MIQIELKKLVSKLSSSFFVKRLVTEITGLKDSLRNPISMLINSFIRVLYEFQSSVGPQVQGQGANWPYNL